MEPNIDLTPYLNTLEQSGVIGLPTETVYGLAARIDRPKGLERIFEVKRRPFFDPLIVHVTDAGQARGLTSAWPSAADVLTAKFWPGPLTLVLPKTSKVDSLITSGLETVGLRCPRHFLAQRILAQSGPLAAPSANLFGRTSPTTAAHVRDEFQNSLPVLDGGACEVGLESTVLWMNADGSEFSLLRAGAINRQEIEQTLASAGLPVTWTVVDKKLSPGQMKHHYMPDVPLFWLKPETALLPPDQRRDRLLVALRSLPAVSEGVEIAGRSLELRHPVELRLSRDPVIAAREFYESLRTSARAGDHIIFVADPTMMGANWEALLDRLGKAATAAL